MKSLNSVVEADHGKLKQLIGPVRGFKTLKTAYATIKSLEVMRALRKGQARFFNLEGGIVGETRIVERAFGLGRCALTDTMASLQDPVWSAPKPESNTFPCLITSPFRQVCNRALKTLIGSLGQPGGVCELDSNAMVPPARIRRQGHRQARHHRRDPRRQPQLPHHSPPERQVRHRPRRRRRHRRDRQQHHLEQRLG